MFKKENDFGHCIEFMFEGKHFSVERSLWRLNNLSLKSFMCCWLFLVLYLLLRHWRQEVIAACTLQQSLLSHSPSYRTGWYRWIHKIYLILNHWYLIRFDPLTFYELKFTESTYAVLKSFNEVYDTPLFQSGSNLKKIEIDLPHCSKASFTLT